MELLGPGNEEGYARAVDVRTFSFPADHGPHPEFRTEWWYFTGNLATESGREFGYQLTFFRNAVAAEAVERESAWATRQLYMAHFALTDAEGRSFRSFERFSRGAVGLAGASGEPFRVWLEEWSAESAGVDAGAAVPEVRLRAAEAGVEIDLVLESSKPPVLQGDRGLSRKGSREGNASYYYSLTRMPTRGTVVVGGRSFPVSGTSWLDREWSTSALEEGQVGWDWFSLQLSDGTDLMFYRLRRAGDESDPHSGGSLVSRGGATRRLAIDDVGIEALDTWRSPATSAVYPSRWLLTMPSAELSLEIEPLLPDQELRHTFRYWEGAVRVTGSGPSGNLTGRGYVELTGY